MASLFPDGFLEEQKKKLLEERIAIQKQINDLKAHDPFFDPDHVSDNAATDTEVREQTGHQVIEVQIHALEQRLADIEHAYRKTEKGTYGYCGKTNTVIPIERLRLIPEARFLVGS